MPATCTGFYWSISRAATEARVYGAVISVGVVRPSGSQVKFIA